MVYAKGSAIIGKHKSIQCPLDPVFQCTPLSKSYEFSWMPQFKWEALLQASRKQATYIILCPEQKYSFVGMPKTASALLVVPYKKFPTNKPSPYTKTKAHHI